MNILNVPQEIRDRLVAPYRGENTIARVLSGSHISNPPPPWAVFLVADLWFLIGGDPENRESVIARSLIWCNAGEPRTRAENLIQLARLWPGDASFEVLCFIEECCKLEAGKAKGSKYRVRRAVRIPETWEPDETGRLVGFDRGREDATVVMMTTRGGIAVTRDEELSALAARVLSLEMALEPFAKADPTETNLGQFTIQNVRTARAAMGIENTNFFSDSAKMLAAETMGKVSRKDPLVAAVDRVLELEKALEPFAGASLGAYQTADDSDVGRLNYDSGITLRHLRIARAAMGVK